jgi:hypothetical protein
MATKLWKSCAAATALVVVGFAAPGRAETPLCQSLPKAVLVLEPLNATGPLSDSDAYPPAVEATNGSFEFAVVLVTYGDDGSVTAHDFSSMRNLTKSFRFFVRSTGSIGESAVETVTRSLGTAGCVDATSLQVGPPVSVNLTGDPSASVTVESAKVRIPAPAITRDGAVATSAMVSLASYGGGECAGTASASSWYSPATRHVAYDPAPACSTSREAPASILFVRDLARLP